MESIVIPKKNHFLALIGKFRKFIFLLVILLVIAAVIVFIVKSGESRSQSVTQRTARVQRGDLNVTITGSGPIRSSNRLEVAPTVNAVIKKVLHQDGDAVNAGDTLFEFDDSEARLNVEKLENNLAQTILANQSTSDSIRDLVVKAPFSGYVSNISAVLGETAQKGANLMNITDESKLKVILPFSGAGIDAVKEGQTVRVNLPDLMQSIDGKVTYKSNKASISSLGVKLFYIEITVQNPGTLKAEMNVNAEIDTNVGTLISAEEGKLENIQSKIIKSDSGGTVIAVNVRENQYVNKGDILVKLENTDLETTQENNRLKEEDMQTQIDSAKKDLSDFVLKAPISGVITGQTAKVGETAKSGQALCTVFDEQLLEFEVSIDELDITKVQVGQTVDVTLDAMAESPDAVYDGVVTKIGVEGTSQNGVTTYPITIELTDSQSIKPGMNANAEIYIKTQKDALYVPIEAVHKMRNNNFVFVRGTQANGQANNDNNQNFGQGNRNASQGQNPGRQNNNQGTFRNQGGQTRAAASSQSDYYKNAVQKQVEVGITTDEFVEILSGLNEGDTVILPPLSTGTSNLQQRGVGGFGGMGGMGGFSGNGSSGRNNSEGTRR